MAQQDALDFYTKGTKAWVEDVIEGWARVFVITPPRDSQLVVEKELTGEQLTIKINKDKTNLPPLDNPAMLQNVDDLTTLSYLHEPAVLENIRTRYAQHIVYTYSGIVLVAMNPFQRLNIYGQDMVHAYAGRQKGDLEPHLFSVAEDAFRALVRESRNQSIIVTGESGAGKTVSTKYVMRYFATVDSDSAKMSDVEEQVMATNPIMESFGNAKTIRNNNSSRFGKYIELKFSSKHKIVAANIRTYLLERSRVVFQAQDERNYHVFYQLCAGTPAAEREELCLGESFESFHYLRQGKNGYIDDVDDSKELQETQNALSKIGMSVSQQWKVFRLLAAILHLGNINIQETSKRVTDASIAPEDQGLAHFSRLLAVSPDSFSKWICKRTIQTRTESITKNRDVAEAKGSRDAVGKFIYSKLFDWIVGLINKSLDHPTGGSKLFIGLLDIYGFEIFKSNSFEQFCINYANEKLQQEFVQHVFKLEQQEYVREGIKWSFIDYQDNQPCIDLIESKLGVLGLLDEESRLPKGSDEGFVNKLYSTLKENPFFAKPRFSSLAFIIKHYAQDVCYDVAGFLEKNKDTISDEQMEVLLATSEPMYAQIFTDLSAPKKDKGGPQASMKATLGNTFKASLNSLMETLRSTYPNFIRCIKPNEQKAAFLFEPVHVLQQLRACGVLETIRISAAGYPSRTSFVHFADRYRSLAPPTAKLIDDGRDYCKAILDHVVKDDDKYQVGKTKIFLRAGQLAILERIRTAKLNFAATVIQKHARRRAAVKRYRRIKAAAVVAQRLVRGFLARRLYRRMRRTRAAITIQRVWRGHRVRAYARTIKAQIRTIQLAYRARVAKKLLSSMKERTAALKIQRVFRGHVARKVARARLHAIVYMQCCLRRRKARLELKILRVEARSLTKYKEVSYRLENKVVELTQILNEEKAANKHLVQKSELLHEDIQSLRQKVDSLKPYKESYQQALASKEELEARLEEMGRLIERERAEHLRKLADRESAIQHREAELEKLRASSETEKRQLREALEALRRSHSELQGGFEKLKAEGAERNTAQTEKISRLQVEVERASKELALEKKKNEDLAELVDKLQNDTTEMDAMRRVVDTLQEEIDRLKGDHVGEMNLKRDALRTSEEARIALANNLRASEEALASKEAEHSRTRDQLEFAKQEITRLGEANEALRSEKTALAKAKLEVESMKDSLLTSFTELNGIHQKLEMTNAELKTTMATELASRDETSRRKDEMYLQLKQALDSEQKENAALRERIIRLESHSEANQQTSELKATLTSNLEEANAELKRMNMSLLESIAKERAELGEKLDLKDQKIESKDHEIREITLRLEKEKREYQRLQDSFEAYKREAELRAETAELKGSMTVQELQLQLKMQEQQLEQQKALLQEASTKTTYSKDELTALQTALMNETQMVEKLNYTIENLKKDQNTETKALKELLASKNAELDKVERKYKEEIAVMEVKFEDERKSFSRLLRKVVSGEPNASLQEKFEQEVEKEPQLKEVSQIRQQSRDWMLAHKGDEVRSSMGGEFEKDLVNKLITKLKVPQFTGEEGSANRSEVLFPSHILGIALSRMIELEMDPNFQSLIVASLRAMHTVVQQKKDDRNALAFWFANAVELRSIIYSLACIDLNGTEVPASKAVAKLMNDIGAMEIEIFHLLFQKIREQLAKLAGPCLLIHDSLSSGGGFSKFLRGSGPTPETLTNFLSEIHTLVTHYAFDEQSIRHLFSSMMYTISTEAFNMLVLKKELCNPKKGLSIRLNLSQLEEWCTNHGFSENRLHFKILVQAAGLLQQPHKTTHDMEEILDTCFLLNSVQVYKLLSNFRDEMDQPVPPGILQFVYERTVGSKDDALLERGLHPSFEKPQPKVITHLDNYLPSALAPDELLSSLGSRELLEESKK